jgi:hypothetical protein
MYDDFPEEQKRAVFGNGELPEELKETKKEIKSFNVSSDVDVEKFVQPLPKKKKEFNGPNMSQ